MSQVNASQPINAPRITVFVQKDAAGHIISAAGKGTDGTEVGVKFPPFPDQNSITFTKAAAPDLVITSTLAQDTCTLTATVGGKQLTLAFTSNGPFHVPHYVMVDGGACPDAATLAAGLQRAFGQFFVKNFDDHFDFDFQQFFDVCKQAALERAPGGVNPLLTWVLPGGGPAGAQAKSTWGVIGRGIVWGVAGVAVAIIAAGGSLALTAVGAFCWGADASIASDIITSVDNSSDVEGGASHPPPTPGSADNQGQLKKDEPVVPPQK